MGEEEPTGLNSKDVYTIFCQKSILTAANTAQDKNQPEEVSLCPPCSPWFNPALEVVNVCSPDDDGNTRPARFATGKVRDVYDLGDTLLIIATDRISAFDAIMPNGIPDKGRVLTQLSRFWFRALRPIAATHYITCDDDFIAMRIAEAGGNLSGELRQQLAGRAMLGREGAGVSR